MSTCTDLVDLAGPACFSSLSEDDGSHRTTGSMTPDQVHMVHLQNLVMEKKLRQYQTFSVSCGHLGSKSILFQTDDESTIKTSKRALAREVTHHSEMTALESLDSDRAANGLV